MSQAGPPHPGDLEGSRGVLAEIRARADGQGSLSMALAIAYDALGDPERAVTGIERG